MKEGLVKIYYGEGKGKSALALGQAMICAGRGQDVFVVQFLKGKVMGNLDYLRRLEPEMKLFRFEKEGRYYQELSKEAQEEENKNIINGLNFVRKVLSIGECDIIVLDEILGLVNLGIIDVSEVIRLIELKNDRMEMVLTGTQLPEELIPYADYLSCLNVVKDDMAIDN